MKKLINSSLFILNPAAGHGRAARVWASFQKELARVLPGASCVRTESPGHATAIAREAVLGGVGRLVAVGGDGTFSEVLEGVMSAPEELRRKAWLASIPAGSGCDFARHLGYSKDRRGFIELITKGSARPADVGRIKYTGLDGSARERHFINIAAFGIAGDVAHHVKRTGKALGGTLSYALSSARALLTARAKRLRLKADGADLSGKYHMCVLANTSFTGGGMLIAPGASHEDGLFDLVLVSDMSRLRLLKNFPKIYRGSHLSEPGVSLRRVKTLSAGSDETVYLNIDGEADGMLPASFEMLPGAVMLLQK